MSRGRANRFSKGVGNRIRFHRDEAGLSTTDLAELLNVTEFTVRRHLRGETMPDLEQLVTYASKFEVSTDDLLPPPETIETWAPSDSNRQPTGQWFGGADRELVGAR